MTDYTPTHEAAKNWYAHENATLEQEFDRFVKSIRVEAYRNGWSDGHLAGTNVALGSVCDSDIYKGGTLYMCAERGPHKEHVDETNKSVKWTDWR